MGGGSGEPVPKRYFTWFLRHRRQKRWRMRCAGAARGHGAPTLRDTATV